jgi:hypothetical protein
MKRLILLAVLVLTTAISVFAAASNDDEGNPNDPNTNDRANACFDGAAWEGKCGDNDYLWQAGWYAIRFEEGLLTADQLPAGFAWIAAPEASADQIVDLEAFIAGGELCAAFADDSGDHYYVRFEGPSDIESDGDLFWMNDSTCSTTAAGSLSGFKLVYAPSGQTEADLACGSSATAYGSGVYYC